MAILKGSISTNEPASIDKRIRDKVTLLATAPVTPRIANIMGIALWAVAEQLEIDEMLDKILPVNCIFTNNGEISLKLDDEQLGNIMRIITYPMSRWEGYHSSINQDYFIYLFIIEELAHHYWSIEDEVEVNFKVLEILKHIFPEIKMEDVYSTQFMEDNINK